MAHYCRTCKGTGKVPCSRCGATGYFGRYFSKETCYDCNGDKYNPCPACDGTGLVDD